MFRSPSALVLSLLAAPLLAQAPIPSNPPTQLAAPMPIPTNQPPPPMFAQTPPAPVPLPTTNPPPAVPPIPPPLPSPTLGATPANPAAPGQETMVPLQLLDVDVKDVLAMYEKWTGRQMIYSTQLVGPIRIFISGQVPVSEAIRLVEMTLTMNGFNIVPSEDPKIWKVTGVGMNPKQVGIPFVDREELLPPNEQVVMFLFKLTWADPTELAQTIQGGILAPSQSGASSVTPLPKAQALLVTDNTNIIRNLIRVVRAIDSEPAEVVSEFITLQHAEAEEVATRLEKLFEKQQAQQTTTTGAPGAPGVPRVQRATTDATGAPLPPGVPAAEGNLSIQITGGSGGLGPTEDNFVVGKVRITADKRTNRLHIVCRPVNLKLIRALISEYDAQTPLAEPSVRPIRFRPVEEVIDAISAAIRDPGERSGAGAAGATTGTTAQGQRTGIQQPLQSQTSSRGIGSSSSSGDSSSSSLGESLSTSERDSTPVAIQVGKSTIIADKRNNSIVVVGTPDVKEKVFALLDKLDVPQAQVMIHTIIGEMRLTDSEKFGVEYILRNASLLGLGTAATATPGTIPPPVGFTNTGQAVVDFSNILNQQTITKALTAGTGGISGFITAGDNLTVALQALQSTNRFRVLNRPQLFTTNNKRAVITSGEEVPVPTSIQSQFSNATTATTNNLVSNSQIQFKPIELRLEVLPLINSDKEVSLEIVQNISERAGSTRIDNNDIPNISRRAVKTYVTVPNNGTLVLGGLIKETLDTTKGGIPRLANIPVLGFLFGKKSTDKVRNELIIMMRPVVTLSSQENSQLREKTFESLRIPPDLEAAIFPENIREQVKTKAPASSQMRGSAPKLRDPYGKGTR